MNFPSLFRAALLWTLFAVTAHAEVTGVSPSPTRFNVAMDRTGAFTVVWNVSLVTPGTSVTSSVGLFKHATNVASQTIATGGGTISRSLSTPALRAGSSVTVVETVVVPMAVAREAWRRKASSQVPSSFIYERQFSDPPNGLLITASVTLDITSGQAAGFGVTRIALGFDDQTSARIVAPNAALKAQAELSYTGAGLLRGAWEVAEPPSTSGEPIFRTLQHLYQPLAGAGSTVLTSPAMPTLSPGLHLLRLRLNEPAMGFDPPEIRYFVSEPARAAAAAQPMVLLSPAPLARLAEDTRFAWRAVAGAQNYLIAFHALDARSESRLPDLNGPVGRDPLEIARAVAQPAVAGVVLNAAKAEAILSPATRQHLKPGHAYLWRVQAVARDGVLLGESDWREMRMP